MRVTGAFLVFLVTFCSFAYFWQGTGPNQNSRLDLTRAIVSAGSLEIDAYAANTFDQSTRNGHVYSDKAPGLSFAAVLPCAAYYLMTDSADSGQPPIDPVLAWFLTVSVIGLTSALAASAIFFVLSSLGAGVWASFATTVAWAFGTNAFAYSSLFLAHQFVAALVTISFAALWRVRSRPSQSPLSQTMLLALAGFAASWASISEYPVGLIAAALFLYGLAGLGPRRMFPFVLAGLPPLLLLAAYNHACFGSPFRLGYQDLSVPQYRAIIERGFFGIGLPDPAVMFQMAFGEFRGLLPLSPFLVLALPGFVLMLRSRDFRHEGLLCLASAGSLWLLSSSYQRWDGGMSMGPRYFVPALPFLVLPAGLAIGAIGSLRRAFWRLPAIGVTAVAILSSVCVCSAAVAVMPEFPDVTLPAAPVSGMDVPDVKHPLTQFVFPLLARGQVGIKASLPNGNLSFATWIPGHESDAANVGEALGLTGLASLLPLLALWALALGAMLRCRQSSNIP